MKKVIFFICFTLIQLVPISASAQKNKPFDYSYLDAGFSEGMKSGVHIIVLQDPIAVKNTICVSEEMEGPPNYRTIAMLGALLSDDHFKVTGSSPDAGYARQRSMLVWYPSIKFNRIMKRENIKDLKIYREYSCNTFILIDEDYMSVKSVL